jgi:uncharacterized phage protein gp47/JayE
MTFNRPTLTQIVERSRADVDAMLPGADSRLRASMLDVLLRMHSGVAHGLYGKLDNDAEQILPDSADGEHLARWASIWGIQRKPAIAATGSAQGSGANGTIIPAATFLVRSDGVRFISTSVVVIAGGVVAVPVAAEIAGADSNCPTGQALLMASPIVGVASQFAVAAPGIVGGTAEEDDADLLARLLLRIRNPPHGGSRTDYLRWTLEVPEVTRAFVYPNWLGGGTVGIAFLMDGLVDPIPQPADVAIVQGHIDLVRPVAANVTVFAPVAVPLNISIAAQPPTPEVEAAITAELSDMMFREAEPGGSILISHIREAISIAPGEFDHVLIAPTANLTAAPGHIFVMGNVNWA